MADGSEWYGPLGTYLSREVARPTTYVDPPPSEKISLLSPTKPIISLKALFTLYNLQLALYTSSSCPAPKHCAHAYV